MSKIAQLILFILGIAIWFSAIAGATLLAAHSASLWVMIGAGVLAYLGGAIASGLTLQTARLPAFIMAWFGILLAIALIGLGIASAVSSSLVLPAPTGTFWAVKDAVFWYIALVKAVPATIAYVVGGVELVISVFFMIASFKGGSEPQAQA